VRLAVCLVARDPAPARARCVRSARRSSSRTRYLAADALRRAQSLRVTGLAPQASRRRRETRFPLSPDPADGHPPSRRGNPQTAGASAARRHEKYARQRCTGRASGGSALRCTGGVSLPALAHPPTPHGVACHWPDDRDRSAERPRLPATSSAGLRAGIRQSRPRRLRPSKSRSIRGSTAAVLSCAYGSTSSCYHRSTSPHSAGRLRSSRVSLQRAARSAGLRAHRRRWLQSSACRTRYGSRDDPSYVFGNPACRCDAAHHPAWSLSACRRLRARSCRLRSPLRHP